MIIEPVPTAPAGSVGRLRRLLGFAMPVVLLAGAIAFGLSGRDGVVDTAAAADDDDRRPAAVTPTEAPATPGPRPTPAVGEAADFPTRILGAAVLTPSQVTAAPGPDDGALVFVAGYLSMGAVHASCVERAYRPSATLCHRTSVPAERPISPYLPDGTTARVGPHLHPEFAPGVRLPPGVGRAVPEPRGNPIPVVILGRFDDPRAAPCDPSQERCRRPFVVERVVWADGEQFGWTTTLDISVDLDLTEEPWRRYRGAARDQLDNVTLVTMSALLTPRSLARIDRTAADAFAAATADEGVAGAAKGEEAAEGDRPAGLASRAIWYVRGVVLEVRADGGVSGTVRWIVTDATGTSVLASGSG